jgi:hypothetical protein
MTGQKEKVAIGPIAAELRIEENTGSSGTIIRLQGVLVGTTPRVGENIELKEGKFKVVEVSHKFSVSPANHLVIVTVEKPHPTVGH